MTLDGLGGGMYTFACYAAAFHSGRIYPITPKPLLHVLVLRDIGILGRRKAVFLTGGSAITCHLFVF